MRFCSSSLFPMVDTLKMSFLMAFSGVESENEVLCVSERETKNTFIVSGCKETKTRVHRNSDSHYKKKSSYKYLEEIFMV